MTRTPRTRWPLAAAAVAAAALGCVGDGDISVLGYSTKPQFDDTIRSVYIPAFKNTAFVTNPHKDLAVDVTEAIVRELGRRRSPIRVCSDPAASDSELVGTIISVNKNILNRNQQNYTREMELIVTAEVVWRDLRTGQPLTGRRADPGSRPEPFDPTLPPPPDEPPPQVVPPVRITAIGRAIPELGESNASAQKAAADQLARYVVNLMESPW